VGNLEEKYFEEGIGLRQEETGEEDRLGRE
jgi:hypothetical protein